MKKSGNNLFKLFSHWSFIATVTQLNSAAVYLKAEPERNTETLLAGSRTRVVHLEAKTTPRSGLLGGVILSRLVTAYESALQGVMKVGKVLCWVGSAAVFYWISGGEKEWKQLVQHRTEEIRSLILKEHGRFCPRELNPADLPTRGVKVSELMSWVMICGGMVLAI